MLDSYEIFKKLAFKFDPEFIHEKTISILHHNSHLGELLRQVPKSDKYSLNISGNKWSFPIGLAAGLDKNGEAIDFFSGLGFGAVEVGTVTLRPQPGNDKPRLFRIQEEESIRNRMGFNNHGIGYLLRCINNSEKNSICGINLGKNKSTKNEDAVAEYVELIKMSAPHAQYLTINISSPNTPGLRDLQENSFLTELFSEIKKLKTNMSLPPVYVKISPDMDEEIIVSIVEDIIKLEADGIIATNTTIRQDLGEGGISGRLLKEKSCLTRKKVLEVSRDIENFEVIGVGGVDSFDDLFTFWADGGKVMQLYTGFIYKGPQILGDIKSGIDNLMLKYDVSNLPTLIEGIQSSKIMR